MARSTTIILGASAVALTAVALRGQRRGTSHDSESLAALSRVAWTPQSKARAEAVWARHKVEESKRGYVDASPAEERFQDTRKVAVEAFGSDLPWPKSVNDFELEDVGGILTPRWVLNAGVDGAFMLSLWNHIEAMVGEKPTPTREVR